MSEFIVSSLKNIVSQIDKLEENTETRSIKILAEVLLDRINNEDDNIKFGLLSTIEDDLNTLKAKANNNIFKDYKFWLAIIPVQAIIWNFFMLKITEDLTKKFSDKRYEVILEEQIKTIDIIKYTYNEKINKNTENVENFKKTLQDFKTNYDDHVKNNEYVNNQIWMSIKEIKEIKEIKGSNK